jgi:hypothetical protein
MKDKKIFILFIVLGSAIGFLIPWQISLLGIVPAYLLWQFFITKSHKPVSKQKYALFALTLAAWLILVWVFSEAI